MYIDHLLAISQPSTVYIWNFFAQFRRLAFISFVSFCLLSGWQPRIPTVYRHQQTVRALTLKPRCDSIVHSCLLVFFLSVLHSITKIESSNNNNNNSSYLPHLVNSLPPEIFCVVWLSSASSVFVSWEVDKREKTNCQQASTNCLCTDTVTTLRQHCPQLLTRLLPVSVALPHFRCCQWRVLGKTVMTVITTTMQCYVEIVAVGHSIPH